MGKKYDNNREFHATVDGVWDPWNDLQQQHRSGGNDNPRYIAFDILDLSGQFIGALITIEGSLKEDREMNGFRGGRDHWGWSSTSWPSDFELVARPRIGDLFPESFPHWDELPNFAFGSSESPLPDDVATSGVYRITWSESNGQIQHGFLHITASTHRWFVRKQALNSQNRIMAPQARSIAFQHVQGVASQDLEHQYRSLVVNF